MIVAPFSASLLPLLLIIGAHPSTFFFTLPMISRPVAVVSLVTVVLSACAAYALGSAVRGTVATSIFFLLLLPYSTILPAGSAWDAPGTALYVVLAGSASLVLGSRLGEAGLVACSVFAVVTFLSSAQTAFWPSFTTPEERWMNIVEDVAGRLERVPVVRPTVAPDIYYVVLDGLARPDVLARVFAVDSTHALHTLRDLGVVFPERGRSNYSQTYLSLASSLNVDYLDDLARTMGDDRDRRPLWQLIQKSGVVRRLKTAGYRFVMLGSANTITAEHQLADLCHCDLPSGPNELEHAILFRSPFRAAPIDRFALSAHRRHVQDTWALLDEDNSQSPKFVFAHVLSPHPPFVFAADGGSWLGQRRYSFMDGDSFPGTPEEYRQGYAAQATYVVAQVQRLFERLVRQKAPVVLIVHADHGSGLGMVNTSAEQTDAEERLAIFSAYFARPRATEVSDDMSPVNALRWALNAAIGTELPLLPNRSFVSSYNRPYALLEVPDAVSPQRVQANTAADNR